MLLLGRGLRDGKALPFKVWAEEGVSKRVEGREMRSPFKRAKE